MAWKCAREFARSAKSQSWYFQPSMILAMVASVLDAGADDFIVKPVPSAVLIARLNMLLRRSSGTGALKQPANAKWLPGTAPLSS